MLESIYGAQTQPGRAGGGAGLASYLSSVAGRRPKPDEEALGFADPNAAASSLLAAAKAGGAGPNMSGASLAAAPHGIGAGGGPATAPGLGNSFENGGGGTDGVGDLAGTQDWVTKFLEGEKNFTAPQGSPTIAPTDYSSDPALQALLMGFDKDAADARSKALTANRNTLAKYGDVNLAKKLLGANDPIIKTISADPDKSTSTLARLARSYRDTVQSTNNDLNTNNLFYGGYRTKTLGNLAKDEQTQEADASSAVQDALSQIGNGLAQTLSNIAGGEAQAEGDAYNRAQQAAIVKAMLAAAQGGTTPTGLVTGPDGSAYDSDGLLAYLKSLGINGYT